MASAAKPSQARAPLAEAVRNELQRYQDGATTIFIEGASTLCHVACSSTPIISRHQPVFPPITDCDNAIAAAVAAAVTKHTHLVRLELLGALNNTLGGWRIKARAGANTRNNNQASTQPLALLANPDCPRQPH